MEKYFTNFSFFFLGEYLYFFSVVDSLEMW